MLVTALDFVSVRSGAASSGSVSESVLFSGVGSAPLDPSSPTPAVLTMFAWDAANVASATSTRFTDPLAPAARAPTV